VISHFMPFHQYLHCWSLNILVLSGWMVYLLLCASSNNSSLKLESFDTHSRSRIHMLPSSLSRNVVFSCWVSTFIFSYWGSSFCLTIIHSWNLGRAVKIVTFTAPWLSEKGFHSTKSATRFYHIFTKLAKVPPALQLMASTTIFAFPGW
jgi:hypothetical protein